MSNVTPICPVEAEPEPNVVKALLDLLTEARAGRLRGILVLTPDAYAAAGEMNAGEALLVFEAWKLNELHVVRNL